MRLFDMAESLPQVAPTGPFASAEEEMEAYLGLLRERVLHLRALIESGAEQTGTEAMARPGGGLDPAAKERSGRLAARSQELAVRSSTSERAGIHTPLARLRHAFGLSQLDVEILLAAAAPEWNPSFHKAYTALWPETHQQPEVVFYTRLLADGARTAQQVRYAFDGDAPLCRHRLVELTSAGVWLPEAPLLYRRVRVVERVLAYLEGQTQPPARLLEGARFLPFPGPRRAADLLLDPDLRERVARALQLGEALPLLHGLNGVGKKTLVETVAADMGRPLLSVDLSRLPPDTAALRLRELLREASLQDAVLLLEHAEVADDERHAALPAELVRMLTPLQTPRALTATRLPRWLQTTGCRHVTFEVAVPPPARQRELWLRLLPTHLRLGDGVSLDGILHRYSLVPGSIEEACAELSRMDQVDNLGGVISEEGMVAAIRGRLVHRLGALATPVTTTLSWDDLVLPEELAGRLGEFLAYARQREHVLTTWGFGRKLAYGRGLSALFSGPPGTGKTMVATLLAHELGLELYRIDLAQVVNKYIGETEKNLGQLFDEASHGQVVLLFDEADSLFAKRTEVKSAHDRYANLEVNYLLQRMENFEGVMILTTNAETAIDPAFRRRIRFRLRFPAPNWQQRAELWRSMIPHEALLAPDVDFLVVAKKYPLSGGSIKNATVRAAVSAAEEGTAIVQAHVLRAAALEYEEMGFLTQGPEEAPEPEEDEG